MPKTAFDLLTDEPPCCGQQDLVRAMEAVQKVHVSEVFIGHCVELVRRTRENPSVELGASPRAGLALTQAARARAFINGRDYAVPEDLFALAHDVLLHRMRLSYEALAEGRTVQQVLGEIMTQLG